MKVIIAGSRAFTDAGLVERAIRASGFRIEQVVSGAGDGIDTLGERWAEPAAMSLAKTIRALKTLAILLPLLFVFGIAAGESTKAADVAVKVEKSAQSATKRAQGPSSAVEYRRYQALKLTWQYRRGGLPRSAQDALWADFQQAYADYRRARFIELGR